MGKTSLSFYTSYYVDDTIDTAAVTNYGGIFPYLDVMLLTELPGVMQEQLAGWEPSGGAAMRGWQPAEHVAAILALNLTGGECVDDLEKLNEDPGIALYMGQIRHAISGKQKRRFSRGGERSLPSLTSVREWLEQFHHAEAAAQRGYGQAFVPEANAALVGLRAINQELIRRGVRLSQSGKREKVERATLDIDATFIETQKRDALACYKKFDAYSGLTVRWMETGLIVWDEFRDGNVPAAHRNLEALRESIDFLHRELEISEVWVRSDAAAHQEAILKALSERRIGGVLSPVRFAIGYKKSKAFREAMQQLEASAWQPICDKKGRVVSEIAEVPFVSQGEAMIHAEPYRHIALRRLASQGVLGFGAREEELGEEETIAMAGRAYHVHAVISNIAEDWEPQQVMAWYNQRSGGGEAVHSILKSDLAAGQLPSNRFGVNAAWWTLTVMAHNLHALLERLAMPAALKGSRFKRLRYHMINVPARLVQHARQCCVRYFQAATLSLVQQIRTTLLMLTVAPG